LFNLTEIHESVIEDVAGPTSITIRHAAASNTTNVSGLYGFYRVSGAVISAVNIKSAIADDLTNGAGRGILCMGCEDVAISAVKIADTYYDGIACAALDGQPLIRAKNISIDAATLKRNGQYEGAHAEQRRVGFTLDGADEVSFSGKIIDAYDEDYAIVDSYSYSIGDAEKWNLSGLPTSSAGLDTGDLWNDSGALKIA
jgi:hypothetical protein